MNENYLDKFRDFLDSGTIKANVTKVALVAVALASLPVIVTGAVVMGNAVQIFGKSKYSNKYNKRQYNVAIAGLKRDGLIEVISNKNGEAIVRITKKGQSVLRRFSIDLIKIKQPPKWDGKWRVVIFDIPVKYSKARHALRGKLKDLGFVLLQKSVFIYPYPCEDEILFIADFFRVGKYVEILTTDSFLNEERFIRNFGLK